MNICGKLHHFGNSRKRPSEVKQQRQESLAKHSFSTQLWSTFHDKLQTNVTKYALQDNED